MTAVVIIWVLCAGFSAMLALFKGRSVGAFFLIGLVFGVFGLAYAAFASSDEDRGHERLSSRNW